MYRATGAGLRWSRINAGSRVQLEMPVTNTRHFRVTGASVKAGEEADEPSRSGRFSSAADELPLPTGERQRLRRWPVLPLSRRRLVLRGDRDFLRALRAAEMAEWEASGGDYANSATETQPAGGGFAGSKVTLAAAAAGNPSHDLSL